jgi:hypothetical protein
MVKVAVNDQCFRQQFFYTARIANQSLNTVIVSDKFHKWAYSPIEILSFVHSNKFASRVVVTHLSALDNEYNTLLYFPYVRIVCSGRQMVLIL